MYKVILILFFSFSITVQAQSYESDSSIVFLETEESLIKQLKPFEGNLVYIDMWAVSCKICIRMFRFKDTVTSFFQEHNIKRLYICRDVPENKIKWKQLVQVNKLEGYHIFVESNNLDSFKKGFGLPPIHLDRLGKGTPRFLLIGKKGEVLIQYADPPGVQLVEEIKEFL